MALALAVSGGGCGDDPVEWELVWEDDFEGTNVDDAKWSFEIGDGCPDLCGWGNEELEYYRAENATVSDGILTITAREESFGGRQYTSTRMTTRNKFERAYGRFEARIQLPIGQGIWPAFWLLGSDIGEVGWPTCGEIDIMEYRGQQPNLVSGALHGPGYSGGSALSGRFQLDRGFNEGFHVFAVEWEENRISWFVDNTVYKSFTPETIPSGARWVFDHPFFIILNMAVGGNFVGPPNASTSFPQRMRVDWVRVYRGRD
jgi:beta-glucanase (GH16 family)